MHKDPFSLFGLPISIFVNEATLNERYQDLMKDLHPDKFIGEDAFMKESAEQLSAHANQAYKNMQSPLRCAEEAIKVKGWQTPAEDEQTTNDSELLMEMMELQEIAQKGIDIRPFYNDCMIQLEHALQENAAIKAIASYTRLKFIARLLGYS